MKREEKKIAKDVKREEKVTRKERPKRQGSVKLPKQHHKEKNEPQSLSGLLKTVERPRVPSHLAGAIGGLSYRGRPIIKVTIQTARVKNFIAGFVTTMAARETGTPTAAYDNLQVQAYLMWMDAIKNRPKQGLYPKMVLDVADAIHGAASGNHSVEFLIDWTTWDGTVPLFGTNGYQFNCRTTTTTVTGYWDATSLPSTWTISSVTEYVRRFTKDLQLVDAETYVSPHRGDHSIFADHHVETVTSNPSIPSFQIGTTSFEQGTAYNGLEDPIRTPWMAALGFFLHSGVFARSIKHVVPCTSTPAQIVWAKLNGFHKLAHCVKTAPYCAGRLIARLYRILYEAYTVNSYTPVAVNDIEVFAQQVVGMAQARYPGCGLGTTWNGGVGISQSIGAMPHPLLYNIRLPRWFMRSISAMVASEYDGAIHVPVLDSGDASLYMTYAMAGDTTWPTGTPVFGAYRNNSWSNWASVTGNVLGAFVVGFASQLQNASQNCVMSQFSAEPEYEDEPSTTYLAHAVVGTTWTSDLEFGLSCAKPEGRNLVEMLSQFEFPTQTYASADQDMPFVQYYRHRTWTYFPDSCRYMDVLKQAARSQIVKAGTLAQNVVPVTTGLPQAAAPMVNLAEKPITPDAEEYLSYQDYLDENDLEEFNRGLAKEPGTYHPLTNQAGTIARAVGVPTHGNWGGVGWSAGKYTEEHITPAMIKEHPPKDEEDTFYMVHDVLYDRAKSEADIKKADAWLVDHLLHLQAEGGLSPYGEIALRYFDARPVAPVRRRRDAQEL
jgi:hypothetical protein